MLFPEEDASLLKTWIVKRLENTSDADADVLADYVLALLRHDGIMDDVRKLCETEIPDFLKEDSSVFVNDVFKAIQYKSYLPGARPPPQAMAPSNTYRQTALPPGASLPYDDVPMFPAPQMGPDQNGGSRKRNFQELGGDVEMQDAGVQFNLNGAARSYKQPRRGGRGGGDNMNGGFRRGTASGPQPGGGFLGGSYQPPMPGRFGVPPPGAPPQQRFDPNDPVEALMQLQRLGVPLPPLPGFGMPPTPHFNGQQQRRRQRCRDYDTKGYCARGNSCMFEHGTDSIFVPPQAGAQGGEEYDPTNAAVIMSQMALPSPSQANQPFPFNNPRSPTNRHPRGGNHHPPRKSRGRAPFSADGPVHDRTKSTIVIENIPEESFAEDAVRAFFSQFGTIVEVDMQPYKHLAVVKFDGWGAANAAYRSPKVIFDNRFVKVFWYKEPEAGASQGKSGDREMKDVGANGPGSAQGEGAGGEEIDMEEFLHKQEQAQKAFVERQKKMEEVEKQREEIEKKQAELLAKQQEERQKLYARIAQLSGGSKKSGDGENGETKQAKPPSQTEALRAQLAALEAEAKQLGLDPDAAGEDEASTWGYRGSYRGRGRGGYPLRGRGGIAPRGAFRGGYRGRGGGGPAAYAAYSLDNRPKKIAVAGVDFTEPEKGEMLRQFLFGIGEFTDINETPSVTQITFKDRKTAEKFFYGCNKQIPGIEGQVELSWVTDTGSGSSPSTPAATTPSANGAPAAKPTTATAAASNGEAQKILPRGKGDDTSMGGTGDSKDVHEGADEEPRRMEMDYDVADDYNQWE